MRLKSEEYARKINKRSTPDKIKENRRSESLPDDDTAYVFFDKYGVECEEGVDVAKFNNHGKHFIKYAVDGRDRGMVFNPYSIYFREGDDTRMREMYRYRNIQKEGFDLYLQFLKTRNSSYRLKLERGHFNEEDYI